ncbi:hypothetical protein CRG98_039452 [Punica granatum]|uniref:G-patch domain-containing protein n=1 Tax=Punica granatum TaxID=22663 RepID=A0A2I0I9W1_PUNGR|nr:hypothetical protein CRG98_039452 [Punica granatum]
MGKSPAHISLLELLLSSEPHRDAFLKVLIAAQVPKEIAPKRIEEIVSSIFSNQISFSEDEIPSEGQGHLRALHIVCKCNNHVVGRVMIDNGSALNVCLVSTLKQMNVDMSRIRASKTTIRAFDGKLITVNGEEDYAIYKETAVPNVSIGEDQNLPFHSFDTISAIRDYGEVGPSRADRMIGKALLRSDYIPGTGLGAHAQGILHPVQVEEYRNRRGLGFRPSCMRLFKHAAASISTTSQLITESYPGAFQFRPSRSSSRGHRSLLEAHPMTHPPSQRTLPRIWLKRPLYSQTPMLSSKRHLSGLPSAGHRRTRS